MSALIDPFAKSRLAASAKPAVEVRGASVVYAAADAPVQALKDIDLRIGQGEFVSLIGRRAAARPRCCGSLPIWSPSALARCGSTG